MLLRIYHFLTQTFSFLVRKHLEARAKKGKEDLARLTERYGQASQRRPRGNLIWVHAVSLGEAMSTLALIDKLLASQKHLNILFTTATIAAERVMKKVLPPEVIHQYVPLDVPSWIEKFINHWQPTQAVWIESELWPNMIQALRKSKIPLFLVNGRISEQAYKRWRYLKSIITPLMQSFTVCFAQSKLDQVRLEKLGACKVILAGNLKFCARPLGVDYNELEYLRIKTEGRSIWLAASTHEGEENIIGQAHQIILQNDPQALCILIPRHPQRADDILATLKNISIARRSLSQPITSQTQMLLADTLGELGLFYRLAPVTFIGGSLIPVGGHNLIEAAQLDCVPVHGPFMTKNLEVAQLFNENAASFQIHDALSLAQAIQAIFTSPELYARMVKNGQQVISSQSQVLKRILSELLPRLSDVQV